MDWFSEIVLYLLIWWMALFAVLPFWTQPEPAPDARSGWRGAPARPNLGRKVLATSLVAALLWGGCTAVIHSGWLDFRHGWIALHDE